MKSLAEHMAFYGRYHRSPRNKAAHTVGVPMIAFSIFVPIGLTRVSLVELDAWVFAAPKFPIAEVARLRARPGPS